MENPTCLNDLIGIKCLIDKPTSGLFINNLPGINLKYAAAITTNQQSGLEFLREKIEFATELVISEMAGYWMPYFRQNSVVDEIRGGQFAGQYNTPAAVWRGLTLKATKSRMLRIRLTDLSMKILEANTTVNFKIMDGPDEYTFTGTSNNDGLIELQINYLSKTNELKLLSDNTSISVDKTFVKKSCGCNTFSSRYMQMNGWNGSGIANSTYGLQIQATAECDPDQMACVLSQKLALPILYRSGMEIVKEAATTDRLNSLTLLDGEKVEILMNDFSVNYEKQMKILAATLPELMKRMDSTCIVCNQSRYVEGRP